MKKEIGDIHAFGRKLKMTAGAYRNGRMAVRVEGEQGEPWGMLTVNIPDLPLKDNEILVKTWEESQGLREPALASGHFVDTGVRVPINRVAAEVWRIL